MSNYVYVLSKMSMPVAYCFYEERNRNVQPTAANPVSGDMPILRKKIFIKGGAGLPSLQSGFGEMSKDQEGHPIWTAEGIVTPISEANYEILKEHPLFKKHLARNQVKVINRDITDNHRAVAKEAAHMTDDPFAPMTKDRLKKKYAQTNKVKTTTGAFSEDENRN